MFHVLRRGTPFTVFLRPLRETAPWTSQRHPYTERDAEACLLQTQPQRIKDWKFDLLSPLVMTESRSGTDVGWVVR